MNSTTRNNRPGAQDDVVPPQDDRTDVYFRHPEFLKPIDGRFSHPDVALRYLKLSPDFYDPTCGNEQMEMQSRYNSMQLMDPADVQNILGVWYRVDYMDLRLQNFHIRKEFRVTAHETRPMAEYYIHKGNIYQAPDLYTLLSARLSTSLFLLNSAFNSLAKVARFHPAQGYVWEAGADAVAGAKDENGDSDDKSGKKSVKSATLAATSVRDGTARGAESREKKRAAAQNTRHLSDNIFLSRVDALIGHAAERQHVVLEAIPQEPTEQDKKPETDASAALTGAPGGTPELSTVGSVLPRKRKSKRDRESDAGSLGGESTVSRKRKKTSKKRSGQSQSQGM
ncbi:Mediator of RNA polymerase II transcription subunit 6 [Blastocladiella emersonii ATCC 22665]|nr:Mediator of RNA polymerase II transcription subunit 6 [Blastocladiella emersonii ATCC 22665]